MEMPNVGYEVTNGVGKVVQELQGIWSCDHVGDKIGCWAIGEVMVVIEMVVDEKDDREVYKKRKVVTKEWTKANSDETRFFRFSCRGNSSFNSIAWIRCASSNV